MILGICGFAKFQTSLELKLGPQRASVRTVFLAWQRAVETQSQSPSFSQGISKLLICGAPDSSCLGRRCNRGLPGQYDLRGARKALCSRQSPLFPHPFVQSPVQTGSDQFLVLVRLGRWYRFQNQKGGIWLLQAHACLHYQNWKCLPKISCTFQLHLQIYDMGPNSVSRLPPRRLCLNEEMQCCYLSLRT